MPCKIKPAFVLVENALAFATSVSKGENKPLVFILLACVMNLREVMISSIIRVRTGP